MHDLKNPDSIEKNEVIWVHKNTPADMEDSVAKVTWKQLEGEKSDRENKIIWIISPTLYEVIALCLQLLGVYQIMMSYNSVKYQVNFLKAERQGETLSVESYWISRNLNILFP